MKRCYLHVIKVCSQGQLSESIYTSPFLRQFHMELRLGLLNFSFLADSSTWRKYCPQSSETVPSYYVNNILLGISGKSFYFCVYFCTWLEKSEKEGGVFCIMQSSQKKKKKSLQKHDNEKKQELPFLLLPSSAVFMRKNIYFKRKKCLSSYFPHLPSFKVLNKAGPFSCIVSSVNSNRCVWNFLS